MMISVKPVTVHYVKAPKTWCQPDNEVLPVGVEDTVPCGQGENLSTNMGMQPQTPKPAPGYPLPI